MSNPPQFGMAVVLVVLGLAWMAVASALLARLKKRHIMEFEFLGRPRVSRYGITGAALVFILRRGHRGMGDRTLSVLSDGALLILVVEIALAMLQVARGMP